MYYLCTIWAAAQCLMPLQGDIIAKTIYNIQYPIPKPFKASTPFLGIGNKTHLAQTLLVRL